MEQQDIKIPGRKKETWIPPIETGNYYDKLIFKDSQIKYKRESIAVVYVELREKQDIKVTIGGKIISLHPELKHIAETVNNSKYILELNEDWDSLNAKKIEETEWVKASQLLINYAKFVLDNFSVIIQAPEINPCLNGTIDLSWRTKKARLLINIKTSENKIFASYYGDLYNDEQPIKNVMLNDTIIEHLAFWMKNLA
jgi:hypothetical protein